MRLKLLAALIACLIPVSVIAADDKALTTQKQKLSYTIGVQIGGGIKQDGLDLDTDSITQGIKDVLSNTAPKMTTQEMQATLDSYQKSLIAEKEAAAENNKKEGEDFLAANKKKKGVKVTDSGLQYKVIEKGDGKKPAVSDTVSVNYRGTLINGKEFDSSYKRGEPVTFPLNGVIKGWSEALQLMNVGAKWQLYIPPDLAYGAQGAGGAIGPNATLIFDVELLGIAPK